jgi:glutamyl-tRNA reductase
MAVDNWHLFVCGMNHKSSTLAQRQMLQLGQGDLAEADSAFSNNPGVVEAIVISTCNRVEFYFVVDAKIEPFGIVKKFFERFRNIDISAYHDNFYIRKDQHAAAHLFRVAAGIDSMVIGEDQVVSQLKDAYSMACRVKTAGKILHRLFHQAFRAGKQVRSDTGIGQGACSVSSAVVELLKTRIEQINDCAILFIGVNQMIALAAAGLRCLDGGRFLFVNRTLKKAESLVAKFGGSAHPLADLPDLLFRADIVISCTSSKLPIVTKTMMENFVTEHSDRKLLIIDMAIPRDIEINRDFNHNIEVCDLDDINEFIKGKQEKRELAIPEAETIIERRLSEFIYWFGQMRHEHIYTDSEESFEMIYQQEMGSLMHKLEPELQREFEHSTRRLLERCLRLKAITSAKEK